MTLIKNTLDKETRFDQDSRSRLARATWLLIAFVSVGFYIASVRAYHQVLLTQPFLGSTVAPRVTDLESVQLGLARLGLSIKAYSTILTAGQALTTLVCCILGFLIIWKRPTERVAWVMSLILVLIGTQVPVQVYALAQLYPAWGFLGFMTNQIGTLVNLVLIWVFPNGRFVPAWSRWTLLLVMAVGFLGTLFPDTPFTPLIVPLALILIGSGLFAQVYRYVRISNSVEQQQTKWVILALIIAPLVWAIGGLLIPALFPSLTYTGENAAPYNLVRTIINNFASLLIPLAIGLSIMRYRLFEIDVIIRRTLVYGALTITLGMAYYGSVLLLQGLFETLTGLRQSPIATVLSTLLIAALFAPLRRWVQATVDRRFYRRKYDAERTLQSFSNAVRDEMDLDRLSSHLLDVMQETMQPESVSLWLRKTEKRSTRTP